MMNASTILYAVIGDPIQHSLSPAMQNWFIEQFRLNAVYAAFHVRSEDLRACIDGMRAMGIGGINVTVPHKEAVVAWADELADDVRLLGAANTLKNSDGHISAHVTDPHGFEESLGGHADRFKGASVLLYGAGGAARSVAYALAKLGVRQLLIAEVAVQKAFELAELAKSFGIKNAAALQKPLAPMKTILANAHIVINATPVGMHPWHEKTVVDYPDVITVDHFFYDLVYNPGKTRFLREAEERGATVQNGLDMLIFQGLHSLRLWTEQELRLSTGQFNDLRSFMKKLLGIDE
ncbi:shikimate dehydrogenase [candidate division KSB1 bacterium]|nr:shikimate dehydrogenase [candidate division KSB1 bacterium]RQW03811.1 MAG: shikimate dehydrogenase [candidate division KSB1 bacterium]